MNVSCVVTPGARSRKAWAGRLVVALVALVATSVGVSACSHSSPVAKDALLEVPVPTKVTVQARRIAGLGVVLTDSRGHALYMFPPDAARRVSCTGACAGTWPPLVIADGGTPTAGGGGVDAQDLRTLADPNTGARIVTYGGHPLYRYSGDLEAGTANGQALFLDGGPWYTLNPDRQPVTAPPGSG